MTAKRISQRKAKQMRDDISELMWKLYKLDDKPHQLFSHLQRMAERYPSNWWNKEHQNEAIRMADVGYFNAFKIFRGDIKKGL